MTHFPRTSFTHRHIGSIDTKEALLDTIGVASMEELMQKTIPDNIKNEQTLDLPPAKSEHEYLQWIDKIAQKNKVFDSYIGMGYYETLTPPTIKRNILENPGWYTQYTPYQAEISQGRLEALFNFQTVISDLTGMPIANASLLDEGTAAAEAMSMFFRAKNKRARKPADYKTKFFVDAGVFEQTKAIVSTRANPLGIEIVVGDWKTNTFDEDYFAILVQYPSKNGTIEDFKAFGASMQERDLPIIVAADILSLVLLESPGNWGASAVVGSTQRLGVPMGFGGPHAAFFATLDAYKRVIPGRIIGLSVDKNNKTAYRMALQTREQHIKRDKATSNICTAQALLAIMASMYAVYHGPKGLYRIAQNIHLKTATLHGVLKGLGYELENEVYFDTLSIKIDAVQLELIRSLAESSEVNFNFFDKGYIRLSVDEAKTQASILKVIEIFAEAKNQTVPSVEWLTDVQIPEKLLRKDAILNHPVFHQYHSETDFMRYAKRLENKDLSLVHSMIPLGSCTMKLNATTELIPISWNAFANMHPYAPSSQTQGYQQVLNTLEAWLCACTGFSACSLQPNSGAQGEYAGLLSIRAYHLHHKDDNRNIALIPSSAHGTNPASAIMAGMEVVVVQCDSDGNIDLEDLKTKAKAHAENLACLMVTYPSTHGVFEDAIIEICQIIHDFGGLVYMDGANMNAQIGYTSPAHIGADVCHLNLHKTFAIPHGGGGPGVGPICVNDKLAPFLPGNPLDSQNTLSISSAPYGSASICLISLGYIQLLGAEGIKQATAYAILNANYIRKRLENDYEVLYLGINGFSAHELIVDLRMFKDFISAEDVAKRLIDYSFHAPTLSFPVNGTIMIEPTESESKVELDRFCDAMLAIRKEIDEVINGDVPKDNNVLVNAPHPQYLAYLDEWPFPYSRKKAFTPVDTLVSFKFFPSVARVDNAHGDRNLICTCPDMSVYMD